MSALYTIRVRLAMNRPHFDLANLEADSAQDAVSAAAAMTRDELGLPIAFARFEVVSQKPIIDL